MEDAVTPEGPLANLVREARALEKVALALEGLTPEQIARVLFWVGSELDAAAPVDQPAQRPVEVVRQEQPRVLSWAEEAEARDEPAVLGALGPGA